MDVTMLLVCPNCRTRYVVPDGTIGATGRQVRCANCRHSWFQEGAVPVEGDSAPGAAAAGEERKRPLRQTPDTGADEAADKPDGAKIKAPSEMPRAEKSARTEKAGRADMPPPPPQFAGMAGAEGEDGMPRRARRNPARYWTLAAIGFALFVALLIASNMTFGWLDDTLPYARTDPPLEIIADPNPDRQTIENEGRETEYFAAKGTIVNPTAEEQPVPPLLIVLYDAQGRKVFDWVAKPRVSSLPPGGSVEFNDAQLEVPRSAERMQIFWAE